ncbi:MAG: hypothetical protein K2Q34_02890 [Alphaproteobacteria bacterium]|nr:hypothetical protein [Alphaproteobacteria bacterium]
MSITKGQSLEILKQLEQEYKELGDLIALFKKKFAIENSMNPEKKIMLRNNSSKSLPILTLEYLQAHKWSTTAEIAKGLLEQGVVTEAQNFNKVISTLLYQLLKKNKVIKDNEGKWGAKN